MNKNKPTLKSFGKTLVRSLKKIWHWLKTSYRAVKINFLTGFTNWIDPKLAKYRTPSSKNRTLSAAYHSSTSERLTQPQNPHFTGVNSEPKNHTPKTTELHPTNTNLTPDSEHYTPKSVEEFLTILKQTPRSVLSPRERHVIATIMNFPNVRVHEIMLPKTAITYVRDDEVLGPLTLDRLYHSGYQHFPVINDSRRIIGLIHTTALNSLEIKETSRAIDILDPKVYYLREDYTLNQALAAFLRTNCYFFLVIDRFERIVGMLTYQMIIDYLLGETPSDNFDRDADRLAVAKRKL